MLLYSNIDINTYKCVTLIERIVTITISTVEKKGNCTYTRKKEVKNCKWNEIDVYTNKERKCWTTIIHGLSLSLNLFQNTFIYLLTLTHTHTDTDTYTNSHTHTLPTNKNIMTQSQRGSTNFNTEYACHNNDNKSH